MKKIAAVIPARYRSSRFPGKPLALIAGLPMVVHVYRRAVAAIPETYVATDDKRIADVCKSYMIPVLLTSSDAPTGTDRVREASQQIDADFIVNVQGDEPLVRPDDITTVVQAKFKYPNEVINAMCLLRGQEEWQSRDVPKVVATPDGCLLYMSRAPIPMNKEGTYNTGFKQVCIYAFTHNELNLFSSKPDKTPLEAIEDIEILRFLELGHAVRMISVSGSSIAVDRPEHICEVERVLVANG